MTSDSQASIYQIKVMLNHSKPSIWRRFLVPEGMNLEALHHTLQIVMGWDNEHLHVFHHGKRRYGIPDEEYDDGTVDELEYTVGDLLDKEGDSLTYLYDFGDGWEHEVLLEKILPWRADAELPRCTAGERACPPEDVGGVHGYERLLRILCKPNHPEYEEMLEWLGDDYNPRHFDKDEVNDDLIYFSALEEDDFFSEFDEELAAIAEEPLSPQETAIIDRYFPEEGKVGERHATYHGLHGFVSAIICAPLPAFPGEWIEALLDTYAVEVQQESEMQALLIALVKFNNQLAQAFDNEAPFLPEPYDIDSDPQGTSPMELWCDGFLHGFHFNEDDWFDLDREESVAEVESCAAIIAALAMRDLNDKTLPESEFYEKMELLQAALPGVIVTLYNMARSDLYAHLDEHFFEDIDVEFPLPAVSAKIGRNEPCPCGSGEKYKKCCLNKEITIH